MNSKEVHSYAMYTYLTLPVRRNMSASPLVGAGESVRVAGKSQQDLSMAKVS